MSITAERKKEVIEEFRRSETDTGSPEVQVAVLTERIRALTEHAQANHKDHAGRRGLLGLVSRRRRLLDYLIKTNPDSYRSMIERLGIRK